MAININSNFKVGSPEPLDTRTVLTKSEMLSIDDAVMPEVYYALCKEDGQLYIYNKENEKDAEIGKFRIFESGGGADNQLILNDMNEWYALSFEERKKYLNCEIIIIHDGIYVYKIDSYDDYVLEPIATPNGFPNGLYTSQIAAYKGEDDDFIRSHMYFTDTVEIHTGKHEEDVNEATLTVQDNEIELYVTDNGEPQWDSRLTFDTGGITFMTNHNGSSYKSGMFKVDGPDMVFATSSESSDDSIKLESREIFLNTGNNNAAYLNDKVIATIDDIPDVSTKLNKTGDTMTGTLTLAGTSMPLANGTVTGMTDGTTQLFKDGIAISNPETRNDLGWIRVTGTGETDTVMEIATGDDAGAGETIVFRGYNTSNEVAYQVNVPKDTGTIALTKNVVSKSGDTITGSISRDSGGSWINGRDNATVKQTRLTEGEGQSWNPVASIKTTAGNWTIGNVGGEYLDFSYDTDADYAAGNNTNKRITITPDGVIGGSTTGVIDYGNGTSTIQIGYSGPGVASNETDYVAVYTDGGRKIKDMHFDNFKARLGGMANADYPTGFTGRSGDVSWGNQTGTCITDWSDGSGGDIQFRKNNPGSGQTSMLLDGTIYVDEGYYKVLARVAESLTTNNGMYDTFTDYLQFDNGLTICFGKARTTSTGGQWVPFPITYTSYPACFVSEITDGRMASIGVWNKTGVYVKSRYGWSEVDGVVSWMAIGYCASAHKN